MTRFDDLIATVEHYQLLASENYLRVRSLAEELRSGLCGFIGANDGVCVRLVPPTGAFEAKDYGDDAFSVPPRGFRPLGPIMFGLAVRVTRGTDWMRVTMECQKIGDTFVTRIAGGEEYQLKIPLDSNDSSLFFTHIYRHVLDWFSVQVERYEAGNYGQREIGFDFSNPAETEAEA